MDVPEHLGRQISIKGFAIADGLTGSKRHPLDTADALVLTLYDQAGELQELPVRRTRSNELFQEWLRRYDRYTPKEAN
jgi:hypothetical protein